jgi:hypothetical protein
VTDQAKPKNPNLRKFTPKAGPNSPGFKRRSKSNTTSNLSAGRVKPLMEQIRIDKLQQQADAVRDSLRVKLSKYPMVREATEFALDRYIAAPSTGTSPLRFALTELDRQFETKLAPNQLKLAKRAFTEELAPHL